MPRTVAIVQARMGSSRLPGKVLQPIAGRPMLDWVVARVARAGTLDDIVVATTTHPRDEPLVARCRELGVRCHRGPEDDVLTRYLDAAREARAEVVVRITSDCPLIDPVTVDLTVSSFLTSRRGGTAALDYLSATTASGYPRGLDTEVVAMEALARAGELATDRASREHVTFYVYTHEKDFSVGRLPAPGELRRPDLRLCVDEPADLELVRTVYERVPWSGDLGPDARDVVAFLDGHPAVAALNRGVEQKRPSGAVQG